MNNLKSILSEISDIELSLLNKYRYSKLGYGSKQLILGEIRGRGISQDELLLNIKNGENRKGDNNTCPICKSNMKYDYDEHIIRGGIHSEKDCMRKNVLCMICGFEYNKKEESKSFINTLKTLFTRG